MTDNTLELLGSLPDDPRDELAELLRTLTEADVAPFDRHTDPDAPYQRNLIHRDALHEVAAARWVSGRSCVLHGHSESAVLVRILSGVLVEERYLPDRRGGYRFETSVLSAGCTSYLPVGSFHRLRCEDQAATVHAFIPPPSNPVAAVPPNIIHQLNLAKRHVLKPTRPHTPMRKPALTWR